MKSNRYPELPTLMHWITERHSIYMKRQKGLPAPWTTDLILQSYRFCNVYRENDKVSQWIIKNWIKPNRECPDLWFAAAVARYINEPATLEAIGFPVPWNARKFVNAIVKRREAGLTAYNPAYIISTGGRTQPKHLYLSEFLGGLWRRRAVLRPREGMSLREYSDLLVVQPGLGTFMVGQIIGDLKQEQLLKAPDWMSFSVSGPGSRRGLNRVLGNPVKQPWKEAEWFEELSALRDVVNKSTPKGMPLIDGQNMQNCLCELDKYLRAKSGEGRPKQRFVGV